MFFYFQDFKHIIYIKLRLCNEGRKSVSQLEIFWIIYIKFLIIKLFLYLPSE